ncbi:hypothetical protein C8R32_101107 [Nitrosospira sp. Nsp5]|uniref:Uncharacterized protein n=1 Tax=Nitrosospira multiformis TaxID=1231 RepID=A0ABY0TIT2_9PROT|nr:hypothetical protein C8R32_101107 [Nitrosospira sp. Nsp5]SDQ80414.1 hypothetical protein SAMN05216402_2355 [Nitrosospira multiformis]
MLGASTVLHQWQPGDGELPKRQGTEYSNPDNPLGGFPNLSKQAVSFRLMSYPD